jgi:outer membrane lipoprotein-sorting protein
MGSDLSYEDMSNRDINENTYQLLRNELMNNKDCYVLEITPKPNIQTEYSKHIAWITTDDIIPIKEESYDKSGDLLKQKQFYFSKLDEYHITDTIKVINVQKNHTTILTFKDIFINTDIQDKIFQEKNLKRILK